MNIREGMVFGCMTPEEQRALQDAKAVEVYSAGTNAWASCWPNWAPYLAYRIAPPPVEPFRVDPIVWQVLDKRWRWITGECGGMAWIVGPKKGSDIYQGSGWVSSGAMDLRGIFAPGLIQRGTCPWQEAIAERPEDTP